MGTLRKSQDGGKCGDGIHHLYAHTLGAECLPPRSAIHVVVTPSHWITSINVWVDAATREEPEADLRWILRRPYAYLPPVRYLDHCQLAPTDLQEWLQEQAAVPARVHYEHRRSQLPTLPGTAHGLVHRQQRRHIRAHCIPNLPTMTVPAERAQHRNMQMQEQCLLCGSSPEMAQHVWACWVQTHEWRPARQRLHAWPTTYVGSRASQVEGHLWEPAIFEKWAAAIATPSLRTAHMGLTGSHDIGTEFITQMVKES